ncbi:MAG: amino acid adenylation domain-containing protein [Candidatus Korobacteraceae bacterium]
MSDAKNRLLERMLRGEAALPTREQAIEPCTEGTPIPLAPSQRQIWLHSQMAPEVPIYNEPFTLRHRGPLDRGVLQRSFQEILRRHAILRTTFATPYDQVIQVVHDACAIPIPYTDLSSLAENERETASRRMAESEAQPPFDLNAGPLLRPSLVKLGEYDYRFHLTFHHLIFDVMTVSRVLLPELAALYDAFSMQKPSPLPEPRLQYADYALWQTRQLEMDFVAGQLDYWRQTLAGEETAGSLLPSDRLRPAVPSFRGGTEIIAFPAGLIESLRSLARQEGVTMYMLLLACFHALLHRYSGREDLMVGGVIDGRRRAEFENLMGNFTNVVVMRTRPRGEMTFREFLAQVKEVALSAMANGDVPFDVVVRDLHPKRDASYNPFYQVLFSIDPPPHNAEHSRWELECLGTDTGASKCDLFVELNECGNGMSGRFHYSSDLFDRRTVRRMTGQWLALLESVVSEPGARLRKLTVMTPAETCELLHDRNDTARDLPPLTIHELIERQVELAPDAVAVEAAGVRLTYRELNERVNRLARRLQNSGVKPGTLVAVCVGRTIDLNIAPLAVLKAGGAYLPLDPGFPKERLAYMVEDARAPFLLAARQLEGQLPATGAQLLDCDDMGSDGSNLASSATPESLAYVRYTSGSTGRPKGVEISHRALVNLLLSMQREPGFTKADSLLAITTHTFDISELELYLPLVCGGRLVIADRDEARDSRRLAQRLVESKCTVLQATPSAWRGLIDAGWMGQSNLKALCGGEALPRDLAELLLARAGELWNLYGPTETTVWSAVQRVTSGSGPVPIGHPIDNTQMYVLDAHRQLIPPRASGELYIGGAGVAHGYLRREELMHRFVPNPFRPGERLYRTGDLARWLPDGTLEYLGRVDNQVKIRGFRIEPGEIEAVLSRHSAVGHCVVVCEDTPGDKRLVAYFESRAESAPSTSELRAHLKELPEYMLPAAFVRMDKLPLTLNGKIDHKSLPAHANTMTLKGDFVAPRDATEQLLAQIWANVLKVKRVGLYDNFFDLGGHSLLAVRITVEIEKHTKIHLPLATLLQAPTIADLAEILRNSHWTPSWSSLVPLQPGGSKPPLFLMHSHGGNVLEYYPLVRCLESDQPVYALQARGLDGNIVTDLTLETMASAYIAELRSLQPEGPYVLGGFCFGGFLALEAARQLTVAGQEVALVVMIQSTHPDAQRFNSSTTMIQRCWSRTAKRIDLEAENLSNLGKDYIAERCRYAWSRARARTAITFDKITGRRAADRSRLTTQYILEAVAIENGKALEKYELRPYGGDVVLFRASKQLAGQLVDEHLGWKGVLHGAVDVCEVPGHQQNLLLEPNVFRLGRELASRLEAVYRRLWLSQSGAHAASCPGDNVSSCVASKEAL